MGAMRGTARVALPDLLLVSGFGVWGLDYQQR